MSFRDELKTALTDAGIDWNDLRLDRNAEHHGSSALHIGFIINGSAGPVMYDTWLNDDLKLQAEAASALVAINAKKHYANFAQESKHDKNR